MTTLSNGRRSTHVLARAANEAGARTTTFKPDKLQPLMKLTGLTRAVQKHGPVRPLQSHLHGLAPAEMALAVVDLLNTHKEHSEVLGVVVSHIWEYYVLPEKLWEHYEGGKIKFMEDVAYDDFVGPTLESADITLSRKRRNITSLQTVWGEGWEKQIDAETDHPSVLSEHYLRSMAKLATSGITLSNAQQVLQHVMEARIAHPGKGVRSKRAIMVTDIQKVLAAIAPPHSSQNIEPKEYSAIQLISILDAVAAAGIGVTQPVTPEITSPPDPPAILRSSSASTFSAEVFYNLDIPLSFNC